MYGQKRYYKNNRRRYKKKKPNTRWQNYRNAGLQLYKDVRYLKSVLNTEYKRKETEINAYVNVDLNQVDTLIQVAEGAGSDERTGSSIKIQQVSFNGAFSCVNTTSAVARLVLYVDKDNSTSASEMYNIPASGSLYPYMMKNPHYNRQTRVLYDKTHTLVPPSDDTYIQRVSFKVKPGIHVRFAEGSTTVTENNIRMMLISDQATTSTNVSLIGVCRVSYTDN